MKNLFLVSLICLFMACKQPQANKYVKNSTEIELFKQSLQDYVNQDWAALAAHYADTAKIVHNSTLKNAKSVAEYIEYEKKDADAYSEINYVESENEFEMVITDKGETWVNYWGVWQGKIKTTEQLYEIPIHITARYLNGKIVTEFGYWDNSKFHTNPENISTIDNLYKAFKAGDVPSVLAAMDAEIVWNEAEGNFYADGNPYNGPEAILNGVFGRILAEHEYFNLQDIELHDMSNNKVLATLRYDAKHNNGNTYNAQVAHLWTLNNGKITAFQQYVDTKKLYEATGK